MTKLYKLLVQIIKFGVVGGIAFLIDYTILYLLTDKLEVYYLLSAALAFTISTIFNYIFSMRWVFKGNQKMDKQKEICLFLLLSVIGLIINQIVMFILVEFINLYYMFAKIIATIIVMIWNFITRKKLLE